MEILYFCTAGFILLASLLSFIDRPHWIFRIFEFAKVQLLVFQLVTFTAGFGLEPSWATWIIQALLCGLIIFNIIILLKYTPLFKPTTDKASRQHSENITVIAVNVYQFNTQYQLLIDLVKEIKPDVLWTFESNAAWENALTPIEQDYPNFKKVAFENTYGMHFYTRLKIIKSEVHYYVADDIPSIEAHLETKDGYRFIMHGVHPPPPSPTEEETSKERDGELMCVAKEVRKQKTSTIVIGDFNTVAWSQVSTLFRKTSELVDPRIGRGLVATYHAKYPLFRFPIDQMFHSTDIVVHEFKVLGKIGSDHFPLFCTFSITEGKELNKDKVEKLEPGETEKVNELINGGKKENGNRDVVAKE